MAYDNSRYNGWTNYATWRVNLEILGDIDLADYFNDKPELSTATEWCKECVQELLENAGSGLTLDYAMAFISDVNWREIATHLLNDSTFPEPDDNTDGDAK